MSKANVIFNFEGIDLIVQCTTEDKMKDICQKYATKIETNINSLMFLYGGNQLNFNLSFNEQINSLDKDKNKMKVLVYKKEIDGIECPNCGEKIRFKTEKIDEIISFNETLKDTLIGIKAQLDNIVSKNSPINLVNIQLKNINIILNTINEDINKNNCKLKNLLNDCIINNVNDFASQNIAKVNLIKTNFNEDNLRNKNIINGILDIELNEINKNIILFNSDLEFGIEVYLNNKKIKIIKEDKKRKIDYSFNKAGKYPFTIVFKSNIEDMEKFFSECSNIISLDFSNFDSSNVVNMRCLFNACFKLKEIKGINHLITNKTTNMSGMFQKCDELEYLNLSNFNTLNVNKMKCMFNSCGKLKEIKGINKFITNNVTDMEGLFQKCNCLKYLYLSNFNTSNASNMKNMFNKCNKLKEIKGINKFITNKVTNMSGMFKFCCELEFLDLSNFNTSNVTTMKDMFKECNNLKYLNLSNFITNCNTEDMLSFQKRNNCKFISNNKDLIQLYNSS